MCLQSPHLSDRWVVFQPPPGSLDSLSCRESSYDTLAAKPPALHIEKLLVNLQQASHLISTLSTQLFVSNIYYPPTARLTPSTFSSLYLIYFYSLTKT